MSVCLSVCLLHFVLTFLSGVSSELSAGDLKHDVEKAQINDNDGDHNDDGYGEGDQKLDRSPGRGSRVPDMYLDVPDPLPGASELGNLTRRGSEPAILQSWKTWVHEKSKDFWKYKMSFGGKHIGKTKIYFACLGL